MYDATASTTAIRRLPRDRDELYRAAQSVMAHNERNQPDKSYNKDKSEKELEVMCKFQIHRGTIPFWSSIKCTLGPYTAAYALLPCASSAEPLVTQSA